MRRPLNGPERPEPGPRLVAEVLRALQADGVEPLSRVIGPHPRVVVDIGEEPRAWCAVSGFSPGPADAAALSWELRSVNGAPGVVGSRSGRVIVVAVLSGIVGDVTDIWIVANPDKLRRWRAGSVDDRL
ncbi:hypothetical protein ASF88_19275 [Leifsonia sp. Leaf336]|uniref:hypothetical protein n=1 Tax=Leifsonia sp. Leaf336 TaxID=1736341 RepID=UPI0006F6FBF7|nr:hypothetical protein [Leifsonia sp. Leaf336]KQR51307.1 hypothetical protein ASF88_19275 [Leifsonia sp. Leaf336]